MNTIPPRRAVYAGSFDPPTLGHLWMIQEAQVLFDELVVAIGINPEKRNTYTIDERRAMLEAITGNFPNVRISVFENRFLVRYAREIAEVSSTMVKGLVGPDGWHDIIRRYLPEAVYEKIVQDYET